MQWRRYLSEDTICHSEGTMCLRQRPKVSVVTDAPCIQHAAENIYRSWQNRWRPICTHHVRIGRLRFTTRTGNRITNHCCSLRAPKNDRSSSRNRESGRSTQAGKRELPPPPQLVRSQARSPLARHCTTVRFPTARGARGSSRSPPSSARHRESFGRSARPPFRRRLQIPQIRQPFFGSGLHLDLPARLGRLERVEALFESRP